jgi:hypothetical protein
MKSVFSIDTHNGCFHAIRPARALRLAIISTLMLAYFLSQTLADEISLPPTLVSSAFDDKGEHMAVASCLKGVGG